MTIEISLPDEFGDFLDKQVATGVHATRDDVVREAIRQMKVRIEWLQKAYQDGLDSGFIDGPLDVDALIAEANAKWAARQSRA